MDDTHWILYVVFVLLLVFSALFSASETAFSSVNLIRLKSYAQDGDKKAKRALKIAQKYDEALSTILVGNNIVNIASASIATMLATQMFGSSGVAISTVVTTVLVLIFGEILPKSFAKENSEKCALALSGVLRFFMVVTYPISILFIKLKNMVSKLYSKGDNQPSVTEDELKVIIETIENEGVLEEQESDLVQSALEFDEKTAQEVLTPRVDVVALDLDEDYDEMVATVMKERFSRIPVFENTVDNIVGIVHARDLLECLIKGERIDLRALMTPVLYVHRTMKISTLLSQLKKKKQHLAVVTDDYGGTLGIVTMEDLLEQLVGEIWDEDDEVIHEFEPLSEDSFEVSGDMNVEDLFDELEYQPKDFDSDYTTVGGWAFEMFKHIPQVGEVFTYGILEVTVRALDDNRITKLLVHKMSVPQEEEED